MQETNTGPSTQSQRFVISRFYYLLILLILGLTSFASGYYIDRLNHQNYLHQVRAETQDELALLRSHLEGNINASLQTIQGLIAAIQLDPDMDQDTFNHYAKHLFEGDSLLRNIGVAPDLVLSLIYPYEGNSQALGLDYRKHPEQKIAAQKAINSGKMVMDGPVDLLQGGQGLIGRIPVYRNNGELWGLVSAVIDLETFYKNSGLYQQTSLHLNISHQGAETPVLGRRIHRHPKSGTCQRRHSRRTVAAGRRTGHRLA